MRITNPYMSFLLLPLLLLSMSVAHSDNDHESDAATARQHTPITNVLYKEECGSCHMAYPPGLLPTSAWQKIMGTLNNHFGDNAELAATKQDELTRFLTRNSKDNTRSRRATNSQVLRITQQAWFQDHHHEIPARLSTANPAVKTLSNCAACHQHAEQGSFSEAEINIPGYGRWED